MALLTMIKPIVNRIRDKVRSFKPQQVISFKDWHHINDRAVQAEKFLAEDSVMYQTFQYELQNAQNIVMENRVHEVREIRDIGDIKKIFITPKEEQINELVGQIKFIKTFLAELQSWIDYKRELEHKEANGSIVIRRTEEETARANS